MHSSFFAIPFRLERTHPCLRHKPPFLLALNSIYFYMLFKKKEEKKSTQFRNAFKWLMERAGTRSGKSRYSCRVLLSGGKLTRRSSAEMAPNVWESGDCMEAGDGCLTPTHIHLLLHLSCFQTSFPSKAPFISLWPSPGSEARGSKESVFTFIFRCTCVNHVVWVKSGRASLNN